MLQGSTFSAIDKKLYVVYIDIKQELPKGIISDLDSVDWICIDNVDCSSITQQQSLFDLYNRNKLTSAKLIIAVSSSPNELNLLKDVKTRLSLVVTFIL
ncbi:hypothetical protein [Candidatus Vesicomyidisocius sp. SY067_SCS001]|uniref:hypothetical protein n=1 Tax=Candidatus Vesicomyidisocius sp. SY067_SCS001 TaxID=2732590 RepID=UPI001EED568D|nr:hypothetical protein [Candidatus Vesicomyosocius sp. SY067_SCS001]